MLASFQELVIILIARKYVIDSSLVTLRNLSPVLISQVVEKLEEENSMLKENIQLLEDSTTVSYISAFLFPLLFVDELSTPRRRNILVFTSLLKLSVLLVVKDV